MKKTLKPRKFLLLTFVLFFCLLCFFENAAAELIPMNWEKIRLSLDCDGQTLKIDALTSPNVPSVCNEWMVEDAGYSEKQLRELLSTCCTDNEILKTNSTPYQGAFLSDSKDRINASAENGLIIFSYTQDLSVYPGGFLHEQKIYRAFEQENAPVPPLQLFGYHDALEKIKPLIQVLKLDVGETFYAEAWSKDSLSKVATQYNKFSKKKIKSDWANDEELYLMKFPVYYKEIRLHHGNRNIHNSLMLTDAGIRCKIRSDKVLSFFVQDCRFHNPRALSSPQPILSLDAAIESYRQYLSASFEDVQKNKVIDKILLEWLVLKDDRNHPNLYHLIPAWCFYYKYVVDEMDYEYYEVDKIHALTGEYLSY